jgi:hypothetical protein
MEMQSCCLSQYIEVLFSAHCSPISTLTSYQQTQAISANSNPISTLLPAHSRTTSTLKSYQHTKALPTHLSGCLQLGWLPISNRPYGGTHPSPTQVPMHLIPPSIRRTVLAHVLAHVLLHHTSSRELPTSANTRARYRISRHEFTLEDAIGSHACSLEATTRVINDLLLGCSHLLPVDAVNRFQTLKARRRSETAQGHIIRANLPTTSFFIGGEDCPTDAVPCSWIC